MVEKPHRIVNANQPLHALLSSAMLTLFLGTLLADWAYSVTFVVQWINFASWLNAGSILLAGSALLSALVAWFGDDGRRRGLQFYILVLFATFAIGCFNGLIHARDAWATMPAALVLSVTCFLLALIAVWIGCSGRRLSMAQ